MDGWIKLHRKLLDNPVFQNEKLLKMFIWCLLKAASKGYEQLVGLQIVKVEKGQFIYGRFKASSELNMKPSTVNKLLKKLEKLKIIEVKSNNKFSHVTIVNWELYQSESKQRNNKGTTKEQQRNNKVTQTRNDKEVIRNEKNKDIDIFFDNTELNDTFLSFLDHRINIKAKMTDRAIELMISKLKKECASDGERIETLNNSILNGWKGIFIKKDTKYPQKKSTKDNFEQREYTDEFLESLYFNAKEEK